jgi:uncharacterized membrane protein
MNQIHVIAGASETPAHPTVRKLYLSDLFDALARGIDDFAAIPSHAIFLCLIYPIVGFFLAAFAFGYNALPLLYPLAAGFALIGPVAAVGLYELSRRREAGLDLHWTHAFDVLRSPSIGGLVAVGLLLMGIFLVWLATAQAIYQWQFDVLAPKSLTQFVREIFTTDAGWNLILIGNAVGFLFALVALVISVVSFPLLLDRDVGAAVAIATSERVAAKNPIVIAAWGLIVAVLLLLGSLPFFFGLAVVVPVLGHATWHLYRQAVDADTAAANVAAPAHPAESGWGTPARSPLQYLLRPRR